MEELVDGKKDECVHSRTEGSCVCERDARRTQEEAAHGQACCHLASLRRSIKL